MQMRSTMENMQSRLAMTENARVEARAATVVTPKTASLVDTRSIGEAPSFSGERKAWHDWSFQLTFYMGSANGRAIEALKAAATSELAITSEDLHLLGAEHIEMSTQLYFGLAMLCKGAALATIKNVTGRLEGAARALRPRESRAATCPHATVAPAKEARTSSADRRGGGALGARHT